MPPRKEKQKLSKVQLRELRREKGIRLEGPVPSRQWPDAHKHHFRAIRSIEDIRYEKYQVNRNIPRDRRQDFKERVKYLRERAYNLLDDINTNESTWRELETLVFKRFDEYVICCNCNNELRRLDFEADFLHEENQVKLVAKRRSRQMCECKNRRSVARAENSDDEDRVLFNFAKEETIVHGLDDDLRNFSISMKPDRVVGLRAPTRTPQDDTLFPVKEKRIMLPFLVVEAKKEEGADGFRAIQYQTAFPIRRLLEAQATVTGRDESTEPCLVWFFAYQGEQWRLHVGTRSQNKVKIYDLWQGTIQSQDGALQLLLIVDYISSWARDIYRPTIRQLLFSSNANFRDFSPASTDRFRNSVSLSCATSPAPMVHEQESMDLDQIAFDIGNSGSLSQPNEAQHSQWSETPTIREASLHDFLRWGVGDQRSYSWTDIRSIRHSNIVHFEFRMYFIDWPNQSQREKDEEERLGEEPLLDVLRSWSFCIPLKQLQELVALWMVSSVSLPNLIYDTNYQVSFLFQTYCNRSTWQIERVLKCIIWRKTATRLDESASIVPMRVHTVGNSILESSVMEGLKNAILDTRQIHGRDSVWYALREVSMALAPQANYQRPKWETFEDVILPGKISETLLESTDDSYFKDLSIHHDVLDGGLWLVDGGFARRRQQRSTLPDLERDTRSGDSMLTIRSRDWPEVCPKFCLFVLPEDIDDTTSTLHKLLEEAVSMKNYYAEGNYTWSRADSQMLWKWRKSLEKE